MTYAYKTIVHSFLYSDDNWMRKYNSESPYKGNICEPTDDSNILFIFLMRDTVS